MLPIMEAVMVLPELLEPGNTRLQRVHNRVVKEALTETLLYHHRKRIPQHYNYYKQKKYRYKRRRKETDEKKKNRDKADLVKTGKSKRRMRQIKIRAGGKASNGAVKVTGILHFKQGMKQRVGARGVTREDMKDEIARWTEEEEFDAGQMFLDKYAEKIDREIKSKRVRLRISAQLRALGITP